MDTFMSNKQIIINVIIFISCMSFMQTIYEDQQIFIDLNFESEYTQLMSGFSKSSSLVVSCAVFYLIKEISLNTVPVCKDEEYCQKITKQGNKLFQIYVCFTQIATFNLMRNSAN